MKDKIYSCEKCQKDKTLAQGKKIPVCCGLPMTPKLQVCTKPFVAETARLDAADEPCNDGTGRNK